MVTPVDAVRSGMGFDAAGHWHRARQRLVVVTRKYGDGDPLAPVRGAMNGFVAGAIFWIALICIAKALLHLF